MDANTNKGPASYFPSIEKKYGHPISYWIELINAQQTLSRHGELVTWLKQEHGIGHGHATALVATATQTAVLTAGAAPAQIPGPVPLAVSARPTG